MTQWGSNANNAANSVTWAPTYVNLTPNTTNQTNLFGNTTAGAFKDASNQSRKEEKGQFGVTVTAMNAANASSDNKKVTHAGWQLRTAGTGPIKSLAVSNNGATFANGETILFSNGLVNAIGTVSTNSTGAMTFANVTTAGAGWATASDVVTAFRREQHLLSITVTGTTSGFNNTDVVTVSNSTVNATASLSTNATGGIVNSSVTITNVGLFANTQTNTAVVVSVANSTGGASLGTGATFVANLTTSTNGGVTVTLGGRADRVSYETLVAAGSMVGAGSVLFPNT